MQYNNGLKFSFSLRQRNSPASTPKFPSIEIQQQIEIKKKQQPIIQMQKLNIFNTSRSMSKGNASANQQYRSSPILQKYSHLILLGQRQKNQKDCKSIKSVQSTQSNKSAKSRAYYLNKTVNSNCKNRHRSVSYSNSKKGSSSNKNENSKPLRKNIRPESAYNSIKQLRNRIFEQNIPNKLANNLMQGGKALKLRLTDQLSIFKQTQRKLKSIPDKGKSFKSLLQKSRPTLRINGRLLTNNKIQEMVKAQFIDQQIFQL